MTSVRGSDPFNYIIQANKNSKSVYNPIIKPIRSSSVMGFLFSNPDFTIFNYLIKMAMLADRFNDTQFNGTLFIVKDSMISIPPDYFMDIGRSTSNEIMRHSWIDRRLSLNSFNGRENCILDTYDKSYQLTLKRVNGDLYINDYSKILGDLQFDNGSIIFIDNWINNLITNK